MAKFVEDSLQCAVCLEDFQDPRVLTCGHTFCLKCLKPQPTTPLSLLCPVCRRSQENFSNVDSIPRNMTILHITEAYKSATQKLLPCGECQKKTDLHELRFCYKDACYVCLHCALDKHRKCERIETAETKFKEDLQTIRKTIPELKDTLRLTRQRLIRANTVAQHLGDKCAKLNESAGSTEQSCLRISNTGNEIIDCISHRRLNAVSTVDFRQIICDWEARQMSITDLKTSSKSVEKCNEVLSPLRRVISLTKLVMK